MTAKTTSTSTLNQQQCIHQCSISILVSKLGSNHSSFNKLVSQSVTDMGRLWSDLGPIKMVDTGHLDIETVPGLVTELCLSPKDFSFFRGRSWSERKIRRKRINAFLNLFWWDNWRLCSHLWLRVLPFERSVLSDIFSSDMIRLQAARTGQRGRHIWYKAQLARVLTSILKLSVTFWYLSYFTECNEAVKTFWKFLV